MKGRKCKTLTYQVDEAEFIITQPVETEGVQHHESLHNCAVDNYGLHDLVDYGTIEGGERRIARPKDDPTSGEDGKKIQHPFPSIAGRGASKP